MSQYITHAVVINAARVGNGYLGLISDATGVVVGFLLYKSRRRSCRLLTSASLEYVGYQSSQPSIRTGACHRRPGRVYLVFDLGPPGLRLESLRPLQHN